MAGQETDGPLIPRRRRLIGTFITLMLAAPLSAQASVVCDGLRQQLAQPTRIIGNTAEVRRYANALAQQNILIRRIKNDMRGYGCSSGSVIVYGNPNAQLCGEIGDALVQAESDRDMISEDRDRMLASQRDDNVQDNRERIMAALDAQGCFDEQPPSFTSTDPSQDQTMGGTADPFDNPDNQDYRPSPDMPMQGGLRTLCVRTCDGAFFPISSNATPLDFRAQAAQCERMCPGTQTELFYHSLEGQESSDMVSAKTGQPYASMPTAFAYRNSPSTSRPPSCSCNMAAYHDEMKKQEDQAKAPQSTPSQDMSSITTITSPKSDTMPKPADIKPAEPKPVEKAEPVPERDYDPNNSKVRIVGPQFLPAETSRIDLKNPALKGAQPQQQ
ncbi:hypothetical protein CPJ18_15315 [Agrobacterium rosae]|nr:DUF2865 domain-containing protein [Agrobacterium rosae]KAA3515232.1 DUF2865 domain-containing protein [Agrobacterium rosae]MQB50535.1 DUF2865 domain-containing protein [Agrobacterium rosae]POO51001.1 hypothetical protein CPJ18_15315 [Agrobacterium rosae]